ncbi:MAG: DUF2232 domain-containing protein [Gammaproteobacteria bacterium]|nr:DUF2232 domain-containing protein [Gammaproteobacteria bacterium]
MRGRSQAVTVASVFAVLAPLLPPLSFLTGGIVGLATLRNGLQEGIIVVVGSIILTAILLFVALGSPTPVVGFILVWVPIVIFAETLRRTGSQSLPIATAAVLGVVAVTVGRMQLGDPTAWWTETLGRLFEQVGQQANVTLNDEGVTAFISGWAPHMTGLLGSSLVLSWLVTLLLARWWHSILDNPGGFASEFRALNLPSWLAGITGALVLFALLQPTREFAVDLLLVLIVVYVFQGLAVAHSFVAAKRISRGWLISLYVLMVVAWWPLVVMLGTVGLAETWVRLRARLTTT